jgi:single-strand DNA-binding protein
MASYNKVLLIGRLTADPDAPRTLPGGSSVIKWRFAVGRSRKNPQTGEWENDPNPLYVDCEAYSRAEGSRNLVDVIGQWAKKGSELLVEGRLQLDTWDDKQSGQKRSKHKVVVENVEFLGGGGSASPGGSSDVPANSGGSSGSQEGESPAVGGADAQSVKTRASKGGRKPAKSAAPVAPPPPPDEDGGDGHNDDIPF